MTAPKPSRQRVNLSADERAAHDAIAGAVIWRPLIEFNHDPQTDSPHDHGDRPYQPGNSLMDRERRGVFVARYASEWAGAVDLTVSDGTHAVRVMLDRRQVLTVLAGLFHWWHGTARLWQQRVPRRLRRCTHCDGLGCTVVENAQL